MRRGGIGELDALLGNVVGAVFEWQEASGILRRCGGRATLGIRALHDKDRHLDSIRMMQSRIS